MTAGIYVIVHESSGRKYVGASVNIEARFSAHRRVLTKATRSREANRHLYDVVQKHGIESLKFHIVEELVDPTKRELLERECFWMDRLGTRNREFGFNSRIDRASGCELHEDTRQLMSDNNRGENNPNFGKTWSDEQKRRMSNIASERHASGIYDENWRRKQGENAAQFWKDNPDKKAQMAGRLKVAKRKYKFHQFTKNGDLVKTWMSVDEILLENPDYKWQNIYSACSGHKPTYRGFVWKKEPLDENAC